VRKVYRPRDRGAAGEVTKSRRSLAKTSAHYRNNATGPVGVTTLTIGNRFARQRPKVLAPVRGERCGR
jgi:hypothetical protein